MDVFQGEFLVFEHADPPPIEFAEDQQGSFPAVDGQYDYDLIANETERELISLVDSPGTAGAFHVYTKRQTPHRVLSAAMSESVGVSAFPKLSLYIIALESSTCPRPTA